MAILSVHRERTGFVADDPFRAATDPTWWDPFAEIADPETPDPRLDFNPRFDVRETDDAVIVRADLPGVHEQNVDVTLANGRLVITGKREPEGGEGDGTYTSCERTYGAFARTVLLPDSIDADHVLAELDEGVLHVVVPKTPGAPPRPSSSWGPGG